MSFKSVAEMVDPAGALLAETFSLRGTQLLHDPDQNKGTAFSQQEREQFGLRGLLPPRIFSQGEQVQRVMDSFQRQTSDIEKYVFMMSLKDRNLGLFYRVVLDHLETMMPIIYTPTVGKACQLYSHIFQRSQGLYISAADRGHIAEIVHNWPHEDVRVVVVTDGERILGLGDLGADGMGIPVGKLALYTACAGIPPLSTLPITLDVGTNNEILRQDPLYVGLPQRRLRGAAYEELVEEFVTAVLARFPRALIQFEDFATDNAFHFLANYRERICMFNDDIQGTAGVTLAALYAAMRLTGGRLSEQRLLFLGAGEAGTGIADLVVSALGDEGVSAAVARRQCWFVDSRGLVVASRDDLAAYKLPYAHEHPFLPDFLAAVRTLKPTIIIGASGQPGLFNEAVLTEMAALNKRPIIFSLSNPTSKSECTAEQAYRHTDGRAIFASGSPFAPVTWQGQTLAPAQGNNAYVFPGVGLGVLVSGARLVTDSMFMAAARTLAALTTPADLAEGRILPALSRIREVSAHIAVAVAEVAYAEGLAGVDRPVDLLTAVEQAMYWPYY
ncbi:MAG: NAD-dependent malic enzyme [Anaerolineales bacterium]|nr:NAD-dependent malic enzyme [Anaerolineales bacterium]